ncbi:MAG: CAP domain-containing protein [Woeseia sp.]
MRVESGGILLVAVMHPKLNICGALVVLLAVAPVRGVADPVDIANSIRSRGCGELSAVDRPLRARMQLDEVARRVAHGVTLDKATSGSGYRARKSASIHIRTAKGEDGVAQMLAQRFCGIVADSTLHEIGVFRRGEETWMVLAAPFAPPAPDDAPAVSHRVLELINEARRHARSCGRKRFPATTSLKRAAALDRAALAHAQDMAARSYMGHKGPDGSMPADRATRAGYAWVAIAENVAAGQTTAEEVVDTWLASPWHCANLMNPRYSDTGVAYVVNPTGEKGIYWAQVFAAPE